MEKADAVAAADPRRWWVLIVMALSVLVLQMDNMVLNVALPALSRDLGASTEALQWIINAYIVVFAGLLLLAGSLSDRYGRRQLLVLGLIVFGVGSVVAVVSSTPEMLVGARALMGVGAAAIMPATMSIPIVSFPDERERRTALSIIGVSTVLGLVGGPLLGGFLIEQFSWRAIFFVNLPVVALAIIAAFTLMTESTGPSRRPDPAGVVLSLLWTVALVYAIQAGPGGLTASVIAAWALGLGGLVAFIIWERRTVEPLVPLALFRSRAFSGSVAAVMLLQFAYGGLLLIAMQFLQLVLGYTSMQAALALIPLVIAIMVAMPLGGVGGMRYGQRNMTIVGMVLIAVGFALSSFARVDASTWQVIVALSVFGLGSGLAQPAASTILTGAIPHRLAGVGSALNDTILQTGAAFGVAVLGSILAGTYQAQLPAGASQQVRESLAGAMAAAKGSAALLGPAEQAFLDGLQVAFLVCAAVVLLGAVVVRIVVPRHTALPPEM